ncbi:hypothetical protein SAMN05660865_00214 [Caloramator fervidus]|uniref:Uncharacterized protein n=1 Tax=Caloramator fervidus TaxID=29344 RepID=A0A1H5RU06_9CLOT|nr:hypothetical protein [Caloramator fervidus]SEF41833.1 hypothetical protein SAMN05660865_00214 [Caloramator fervidus]
MSNLEIMMDALANEVKGLSWIFCNVIKPSLENTVSNPNNISEVKDQINYLKSILCGYTAKESAIADIIKSIAKIEATNLGIDPTKLCKF